jgi:hypothetical protein
MLCTPSALLSVPHDQRSCLITNAPLASTLMKYRLSGVSLPWFGAQWERVPGDREVAEQTITFLEDRRVLFTARSVVDHRYCLSSVNEIRQFLTAQISAADTEELEASLRAMRAACRKFVDAAGPDAQNFKPGWPQGNALGFALGDLRTLIGVQVARIATEYDLPIEEDLAAILPPHDEDDLSWIPGFRTD